MSSAPNETSKKEILHANEPFNDVQSSDTIFRTSDGIDFYIHRVVLFLASPFFRDMFSLPQPPSSDTTKPIIVITESSKVLDPLLRYCYPVDYPEFPDNNSDTLALIGDALEAALKYQLTVATKILKGHLRTFSKDHPLHTYAIACRLQLEEEASLAAHRWRESHPELVSNGDGRIVSKGNFMPWKETISGASYIQEMSNLSAGVYYRLIQFVRTGVQTSFCVPPKTEDSASQDRPLPTDSTTVSEEFDFPDSDITVLSSDNVEFRVHQLILRLASPAIMENMSTDEEGKHRLLLPEDCNTLSAIFAIYYPGTDVDDIDASLALPLLSAVRKYKMMKAIKAVKTLMTEKMHTDPLRIYLAFAQNGCLEDAATVARNALFQKPLQELYIPEIEDISAELYYQLLEYRHQCLSSIVTICAQHEGDASLNTINTDWWAIVSPSSTLVLIPKSLSLASPIAERQLKSLQEESRKHYINYYKGAYRYNFIPSQELENLILPIGKFNLRELYDESKRLEEELNSTLSTLKIQLADDSIYKAKPVTFSKEQM